MAAGLLNFQFTGSGQWLNSIRKLDVKESFLQVFAKPSYSGQEFSSHCTLLDENTLLGSSVLSTGTTLANSFPPSKALVVLFSKQNLAPQHSCNL
jgi:hypothetical protein